jgi:hypothetical protein
MNLIVLPAMIGALIAGYLAIATRDYDNGQDRLYATDSMLRHHELAVEQFTDGRVANPTLGQDIPVVTTPFVDVLAWNSALAIDTTNRLWMLTFIGPGDVPEDRTISDAGIAGIQFELAKQNYSGGTFGRWNDTATLPDNNLPTNGFINSTIGPIEFLEDRAPPIVDLVPVIATILAESCTGISQSNFVCSDLFVR